MRDHGREVEARGRICLGLSTLLLCSTSEILRTQLYLLVYAVVENIAGVCKI